MAHEIIKSGKKSGQKNLVVNGFEEFSHSSHRKSKQQVANP
jgi:hypothetical protein